MSKKLDEILYTSLRPEEEPGTELNRQILQEWSKEEDEMTRFNYKKKIAAAITICVLAGGGMTTYAAYHFLNPAQVVQTATQNDALMKAFEGKDAILVNDTQSTNGYDISLLGLVSGDNLQLFVPEDTKESIEKSHTYAAIAVAKSDGTPMDDRHFCISPVVNGVSLLDANIATLSGTATWFLQDGIVYQLIECDNLEMFADKGVNLGVVDDFGDETRAFTMDEQTGVYSRVNDYSNTNALFTLPLDASKANPEEAEKYLNAVKERQNVDEDDTASEDAEDFEKLAYRYASLITEDNVANYFSPIGTATAKPDADGNIEFNVKAEGGEYSIQEFAIKHLVDQNCGYYVGSIGESEEVTDDLSNMIMYTITENEDGSFTITLLKAKHNVNEITEEK